MPDGQPVEIVHQAVIHTQPPSNVENPAREQVIQDQPIDTQTLPPPKPATRGRKKKDAQQPPAKVARVTAAAGRGAGARADADLSSQIGEILQLLRAQATRPQAVESQPRQYIQEPPPRAIASQQPVTELLHEARVALDSRLPTVGGNVNIEEFLTRKSQRRVKENSIDAISFNEFVYAFIGHILDAQVLDQVTASKLQFLRQIAEDSEAYNWTGVLDWALTTLERINSNSTTWAASQDRAMDRLVISRSVSNAIALSQIPCMEYNQGTCRFKASHQEGRFALEHLCNYCFAIGIEHPHTDRACHRKKQITNNQSRAPQSSANRSDFRQRNYRQNDYNPEVKSDSKN